VIAAFVFAATPAMGQNRLKTAETSAVLKSDMVKPDSRARILAAFLKEYDSPLVPFTGEFVKAADAYGLDWRLVPAITGVESTFGKRIPYNSYNAYGWANGVYKFQSWEDSIWHVSKALREKYLDKGADTVWEIGRIYAPPSSTWAGKVNVLMAKINQAVNLELSL